MINLLEFKLESETGERLLFISPIKLPLGPVRIEGAVCAFIYENLIKEDWLPSINQKLRNFPNLPKEPVMMVKLDQDFEQAYLGEMIYNEAADDWEWIGNVDKLKTSDIRKITVFLSKYKRDDK